MTFPSFPAAITFASDNRKTFVIQRVYDRAQTELDMHEVREAKAWLWADALAMDKGDVLDAWNWLVANGYLLEHERGERLVRRFTLTHSVRDDLRPKARPVGNPHPSVA
jgi:hypothetical protein